MGLIGVVMAPSSSPNLNGRLMLARLLLHAVA
jgi:hypothetical protein